MRLANLFDEAQLASIRHITATAAPRATKTTGSDGRIPIRPNYHSAGRLPMSEECRQRVAMRPTSAPSCEDTASGTRRKWGEPHHGEQVVDACLCIHERNA